MPHLIIDRKRSEAGFTVLHDTNSSFSYAILQQPLARYGGNPARMWEIGYLTTTGVELGTRHTPDGFYPTRRAAIAALEQWITKHLPPNHDT